MAAISSCLAQDRPAFPWPVPKMTIRRILPAMARGWRCAGRSRLRGCAASPSTVSQPCGQLQADELAGGARRAAAPRRHGWRSACRTDVVLHGAVEQIVVLNTIDTREQARLCPWCTSRTLEQYHSAGVSTSQNSSWRGSHGAFTLPAELGALRWQLSSQGCAATVVDDAPVEASARTRTSFISMPNRRAQCGARPVAFCFGFTSHTSSTRSSLPFDLREGTLHCSRG